jgi:hypothetical protein
MRHPLQRQRISALAYPADIRQVFATHGRAKGAHPAEAGLTDISALNYIPRVR